MTPASFQQFLTELLAEESIAFFNPPTVQSAADRSKIIGWPSRRSMAAQKAITESTVGEYVAGLKENNYTCLLPDAAMLQIEYKWQGGALQYHRYCYIPAPFDLGGETVSPDEIEALIDLAMGLDVPEIRLRTKLRFEFDEMQMAPSHPKCHFHIHCSECRIPVKSFIGVHSFFRFVYRYFCADRFSASRILSRRRNDGGSDSLSAEERLEAHFFWHAEALVTKETNATE